MARCNCAGNSCSCKIQSGGGGIAVDGIGTAANPYTISLDSASIAMGGRIQLDDSTTIELSKVGDGVGTVADPVVLKADIVLTSPDGSRWRPAISNAGVVTYSKI